MLKRAENLKSKRAQFQIVGGVGENINNKIYGNDIEGFLQMKGRSETTEGTIVHKTQQLTQNNGEFETGNTKGKSREELMVYYNLMENCIYETIKNMENEKGFCLMIAEFLEFCMKKQNSTTTKT